MNEQIVKEGFLDQPTTPVMEIHHIVIKEEHHENVSPEPESWDVDQVKQEPETDITIDDNTLQLPEEMAQFSLTERKYGPHVALKEDPLGTQTEVLHNTSSPDCGMQLSANVKSSSLPVCEIPSVHQYSRDTVKESAFKETQSSTMLITGMQMRKNETDESNKPLSHNEMFNTTEKTVTYDTVKLFTCEICHKDFSTLYNLKTHIRIHTGSKPYTCDTCLQCFSTQSDLKKHTRIHTGSKPYTCDSCHKSFSQLCNLITHRRIHTGSKPYTCDTCHKCFSQLSNLKRHSRIHTGNKPYTCDTCNKCFSHQSTLTTHIRIHTGSKPYTCDTCHKSFNQLCNFKVHGRRHNGSEPYTCDTCHKCFREMSILTTHIRTHSGSNPYTC